MNASARDVVIIQRGDALATAAYEGLLQKGFRVQIVTKIAEALETLKSLNCPAILVDCGNDEEQAYTHVKSIIDTSALHQFATVIVGKDVDAYEVVLGRYFKNIATITTPCAIGEVVRALEFIIKAQKKSELVGLSTNVEAPDTGGSESKPASSSELRPSEISGVAKIIELESEDLQHVLYNKLSGIPELIFKQFTSHKLFEKTLNGVRYTSSISEEEIRKRGLFPTHQKAVESIEVLIGELGKWGKGHIFRVSFLTEQILDALNVASDQRELSRTAAFLYCWSFGRSDRSLLKQDYHSGRLVILRKDICSRIKDSAMNIAVDLLMPEVGNLVALIGKFVGKEAFADDTPHSIIANAIMSADLVDRACFRGGYWSPRAAHALLRKLRAGKMKEIHPSVLACLIKLLSEAAAATPGMMLSKKQRLNSSLVAEAQRIAMMQVAPNERKVPLTSLEPGMRLSRPLTTYDGRQILSPDVLLDEDLIWRIWQLSSIRPLNGPAIILSIS